MSKKPSHVFDLPISIRKRLMWVLFFLSFLFTLLLIQFYNIQMIQHDKWTRLALAQHQIVVIEPAARGRFYSNGSIKTGHPDSSQPFVVDIPKFQLFIDCPSIPLEYKKSVINGLTQLLNLSLPQQEQLAQKIYEKNRSYRLVRWLDPEKKVQIENYWLSYIKKKRIPKNALYFVRDYQRSYPFGKMLGPVLHTVRDDKDEQTHQNIPTGGLELAFNKYLKGQEGKRLMIRSSRHALETDEVISYPQKGSDIYLTINHYLQAIAEEEIEKAVKKTEAKGGWAIVMDPHNGEILALAQYPWFYPADYRRFYNNPILNQHTKVKALTDPFEPGSIFKPITLAVCLKANQELSKQGKKLLFDPLEKVNTDPCLFPGRSKVIKDTSLHHHLNMNMALQKSSNVYMAKMIQRVIEQMGDEWYRHVLHDVFGFGKKTGIELPGEPSGLLPKPGKKHANGGLEWSKATPYSLSFGHNILVNGFQMLKSYALIANGGFEVHPTLIKKIKRTNKEGHVEILYDESQRLKPLRLLDESICKRVIEAMKFVTKPGGSASKGDIPGYTEAGKTGTAEKVINGRYCSNVHFSTFVGIVPADKPRFIIMVAIDEPVSKYIPGFGKNQLAGNCAAPVFKELGLKSLEYLGVKPDDPFGYPQGDPRSNREKADMYGQLQDLQKLYKEWNR
ncbi:MAG: peptidoglycan D,D-transpeptidase FtsI family protein [Rhabdochlamydiaceae bacterium]